MEDILSDVKPEYHFITKDGKRIKNLYQLHKSLLTMDDVIFNHHVNAERNDFYNWVRDMYGDDKLKSAVLKCKTKKELAQKIKEELDDAVKKKKEHDLRLIIKEAKEEVKQKLSEQKKAEEFLKRIESRPLKKEVKEEVRKEAKYEEKKIDLKKEVKQPEKKEEYKPVKHDIKLTKKTEDNKVESIKREVRDEVSGKQPKEEENVFVPKPPRTFAKEEKPVTFGNVPYIKASAVDFVFGIIIGVIVILIIKQLL